jgi:hypothetical protein
VRFHFIRPTPALPERPSWGFDPDAAGLITVLIKFRLNRRYGLREPVRSNHARFTLGLKKTRRLVLQADDVCRGLHSGGQFCGVGWGISIDHGRSPE